MDFDQGIPPMSIVVYLLRARPLLQIPLAARMRVRLHRSRTTFRVNWPLGALLLAVPRSTCWPGWRWGRPRAPLPARWPGLLMAVAYAGRVPLASNDRRRLLARADERRAAVRRS